ncbi:hypothetical protein HDU88_005179 [Geranomyces variabilis]|nr:hypothetical protein HDU88_005179 [Geranomyces variabilis]
MAGNATDTWLDLPLPAYNDFLSVTAGTTVSPHGIRPRSVRHWPQFLTEAAAYRFPHTLPQNALPAMIALQRSHRPFAARNEPSLHRGLLKNIETTLEAFMAADPGKNYYVDLDMPDPRGGRPDLSVTCGTQRDPMRNPAIFVMEVKKPPFLHHSPTGTALLHTRYNTGVGTYDQGRTSGDTAVVLAVFQTNGYLNAQSLRYGALTSYDFTWFLRREGDVLYISDPIHSQTAGPASCSVMRAIAHTLTLGLGNNGMDGRSPPAPSYQAPHGVSSGEANGVSTEHSSYSQSTNVGNPLTAAVQRTRSVKILGGSPTFVHWLYNPGSGDSETSATDGNNNGSGSGTLSDALQPTMSTHAAAPAAGTNSRPIFHPFTSRYTPQNPQDVVWGSFLGHGLLGTVIRCQWKGRDVAIKTVDRKSHANAVTLGHEAALYALMMSLQGTHVPSIYAEAAFDNYQILGLVMERGIRVDWTSVSQCRAARASLAAVHGLGIAHGDVSQSNFICVPSLSGPRVFCIDFALGKADASRTDRERERAVFESFATAG